MPEEIACIRLLTSPFPTANMTLGIAANLALEQARQIQRWATRQHQEQQAPALARRSELSAATPAVGGDVVAGSGAFSCSRSLPATLDRLLRTVPNNRSLGQLRRWSRQRASRHSAVPLPHSGPAPFPMAADLLPPPAVAQRRAITPDGAHIAQGALQPLAAPIPVPTAGALRASPFSHPKCNNFVTSMFWIL